MVESSIRGEGDEAGGRVAIATFCRGNEVGWRFADGDDAVMTTTASTEYFGVVNRVRNRKPFGRMASLAHIACSNMGARFARECRIRSRVTLGTIIR